MPDVTGTLPYEPSDIDVVEVRLNGQPWQQYGVRGNTVFIAYCGRQAETVTIVCRRDVLPKST